MNGLPLGSVRKRRGRGFHELNGTTKLQRGIPPRREWLADRSDDQPDQLGDGAGGGDDRGRQTAIAALRIEPEAKGDRCRERERWDVKPRYCLSAGSAGC